MISFIDVTESSWFYEDIMEAANTFLKDGTALIEAVPYNKFIAGKPYVLREVVATNQTQKNFTIPVFIASTATLYIYVDGVRTSFKSRSNPSATETKVELHQSQQKGSVVTFVTFGSPQVDDRFKRPLDLVEPYTYPQRSLDNAGAKKLDYNASSGYYYDTYIKGSREICYVFGEKLRRIHIPKALWRKLPGKTAPDDEANEYLVRQYLKLNPDIYTVSPWGRVYLPYNVNGARVDFTYMYLDSSGELKKRTETFNATAVNSSRNPSGNIIYNNRVFPNAYVNRGEVVELVSRLRSYFFERLTDTPPTSVRFTERKKAEYVGQRIFKLDNYFIPDGNYLKVYNITEARNVNPSEYEERPDGYTVIFKNEVEKGTQLKFSTDYLTEYADVGVVSQYVNKNSGEFESVNGLDLVDGWSGSVLSMYADKVGDKKVLDGFISYKNYKQSIETVLTRGAYDGAVGVRPCISLNPILIDFKNGDGSSTEPFMGLDFKVSRELLPTPTNLSAGVTGGKFSFQWEMDISTNTDKVAYFEIWSRKHLGDSTFSNYSLLSRENIVGFSTGTKFVYQTDYFFHAPADGIYEGVYYVDPFVSDFKVRVVSIADVASDFSATLENIEVRPALEITSSSHGTLAVNYINEPIAYDGSNRFLIYFDFHSNHDYYKVYLDGELYGRIGKIGWPTVRFVFYFNAGGKVQVEAYNEYGELRSKSSVINIDKPPGLFVPSVGKYVKLGKYNGYGIIWRAVDISDNGNVLLMSDRVITFKSFSAAGNSFSNPIRRKFGSNLWVLSNIREWLNSNGSTVTWSRNSPKKENLKDGYNPYDDEAGFLSDGNFTELERSMLSNYKRRIIVSKNNIGFVAINLPQADLIGTEPHKSTTSLSTAMGNYDTTAYKAYVTDKVFLPSIKLLKEKVLDNSSVLGSSYHRAKPTQQAIDNSDYTRLLDTDEYCEYWLETPYGIGEILVRIINDFGIPIVDNNKIPVPDSGENTYPYYFFPDTPILRGEFARVLNLFRLWCIETFKN